MVDDEREVERRIAEPRAFRVDDDRSMRADQDVLRAEVAVHEHAFGGCRGRHERIETGCVRRIELAGRDEVWIEPYRMEHGIGGEAPGDAGVVRRGGVDAAEDV